MDVLDVRLPRAVRAAAASRATREFETAKVDGRTRLHASTPTAATCARRCRRRAGLAPRARRSAPAIQPPERAAVARPGGPPRRRRRGPRAVARPEVRARRLLVVASRPTTSCASASARSTRATTSRSRRSRLADDLGPPAEGYQGNWIPHQLRAAVEDGVFFVGDSAGHCLPTTAEGIRTALLLRAGVRARAARRRRGPPDARAGAGTATARSPRTTSGRSTGCCASRPRRPASMTAAADGHARSTSMDRQRFVDWAFAHYLDIAPPSYV